MKKLQVLLLAFLSVLVLAGCSGNAAGKDGKTVKVGVTGTDGQVWDIVKKLAKEEGINVELVEFQDYTLPNQALANGEIDLNSFQHIAFLSEFTKQGNLDLVPIGSTVIAPMGVYSEKYEDIADIPDGSKIAIPDDPSNQARALRLLETAGLIELADDFGLFGDPSKITSNPKNLDIYAIVAQQTPRVLPDVAASVINNGVAGQAGFDTANDPIYLEDANDESVRPYINVFAARAEDATNETYLKLVEIYHHEDVIAAVKEDTNGGSLVVDLTQDEILQAYKELGE